MGTWTDMGFGETCRPDCRIVTSRQRPFATRLTSRKGNARVSFFGQYQSVLLTESQIHDLARSRSGRSTMPLLYPSILFQERMLGFALGGLVGMGVFMYEQRHIWKSTAGLAEKLSGGNLPPPRGIPSPPPLLGREMRDDLAHVWNSTIDKTFGSVIHTLSSKGW